MPRNARACPGCGSDSATGWSEEARADGLDLPDEEFNYDDFVKNEFGLKGALPHGVPWFWWLVGVGLVLAFLWFWLL